MGGKIGAAKVVPLSESQKQQWADAIAKLDDTFLPALAWQGEGAGNKRVFVAAFDGTWNDRDNLSNGERPTNPASLERLLSTHYDGKMLEGRYYHGVGTRENGLMRLLHGMTGEGTEDRAEQAYRDFQQKAQEWLKEDPSAQIHVFATGFSRGAASARHFLNLVDERGVPSDSGRVITEDVPSSEAASVPANETRVYDSYLKAPGTVTSSALLYDTVATGQEDVIKLGIPASTRFVLHLTSQDESRVAFPLTEIGHNEKDPVDSSRFMTISLPGVHSDIGGGYSEGVSKLGLYMGEQALYRLGFEVEPGQVPKEAFAEGMHRHVIVASPEDFSEMPMPAETEGRHTKVVGNASLTDAERRQILEENREAANAAAMRYLEGIEKGSAPQDPWGFENHGIALTPQKDGTMDVYLTNPSIVSFNENTGTISVYGKEVRRLTSDDYANLEAGEPIIEVFSVVPENSASLLRSDTPASVDGLSQARFQESTQTAEASAQLEPVMAR